MTYTLYYLNFNTLKNT